MSLFIKKTVAEVRRSNRLAETASRIFPTPFEERRGWVGFVPYSMWQKFRYTPLIIGPFFTFALIVESRSSPTESALTPIHVWLADCGWFRHDTIKAVNPAYDDERINTEWSMQEVSWRASKSDTPSLREIKEFVAINAERRRQRERNDA
jgi:hypothetical protein